ncbi:metallophosphoesterase [Sphingobacterium sp. UME9]|uniref:metallophosphoesterase n=1 Tax=Sphingobacterium sp. UME9 TaxID=1862316 RepID=UPI00160011EB|nr:metallophosphoesterase [Sphingobacterium sp. UME9]MBB1643881.1 hypothetical protein [Sphingobacterium sp. UME9]
MRIVQLSDIHLSKENRTDLRNSYLEALIKDLQLYNAEKQIDLILITGDLVDKGGESFEPDNPYQIFKTEIIDELVKQLDIASTQILMVPGNHDIERGQIHEENEFFLAEKLTSEGANKKTEEFISDFKNDNLRIKRFKEFEKEFHSNNIPNYIYSNNESLFIFEKDGIKIGFALINDSWRCSADLTKEQHFIGYAQLLRANNKFKEHNSAMNIAVFHHPLNAINDNEKDEIKSILKSKDFDIAFFGHSHRHEAEQLSSSSGGYLSINGRSAFSESKQELSRYQPGYNILDVDVPNRGYILHARKYISTRYEFDKDTDSLKDGIESSNLPQKPELYQLAQDSNNEDTDLPSSYTADVHRIVSLLIGESIYPDKYIFIRELIQNSVDACNRMKESYSHLTPKITINIDYDGNYVEVTDEGDGMSKSTLKNHFSVLGKSISQEYNDNNGHQNLISKFGIGFISTFIAAEKVLINTKSEEDGQIMFEIENVFKGFKYLQPYSNDIKTINGTTVRVYLKKPLNIHSAYSHVIKYCRHIENLEIKFNGQISPFNESWNIEDSFHLYENKTHQYDLKLGIGLTNKNIIASYCGFLINDFPVQIVPSMFPAHIGGEVNFFPKSIDFDISRTNIIATGKEIACMKEISISLRKLFRQALEQKHPDFYLIVVNYIHCYLQYYDQIKMNLESFYSDFYSKTELIAMCMEHTKLKYDGDEQSLINILPILKSKSIDIIYIQNNDIPSDYESMLIQYLENKGNLVIKKTGALVYFHYGSQFQTNLATIIQIIANENNFHLQNIELMSIASFSDIKMDKSQFNKNLQIQLEKIEEEYAVIIEISKFKISKNPYASIVNQIYINCNHPAFMSLLAEVDTMPAETLRIYLLGLLGLGLNQPLIDLKIQIE